MSTRKALLFFATCMGHSDPSLFINNLAEGLRLRVARFIKYAMLASGPSLYGYEQKRSCPPTRGAALALFLDHQDSVAGPFPCMRGRRVVEQLALKAGKQPFSKQILSLVHADVDRADLATLTKRTRGNRSKFPH